MTDVPFRGQLTEEQYMSMAQLIWPKMLKATPFLVFVGVGILLWRLWPLSFDQPFRILQVLIVVAIGVAVAMAPKIGARKAWRSDPILQVEIHGSLSDEGLRWQQEERGIRLPWSSIVGYRATDDFLLLYRTPRQFLWLMRSFFASQEDWQRALALASQHSKPH